jgi:hypothetical protein
MDVPPSLGDYARELKALEQAADMERERAEAEKQRADEAEKEIKELRALLKTEPNH